MVIILTAVWVKSAIICIAWAYLLFKNHTIEGEYCTVYYKWSSIIYTEIIEKQETVSGEKWFIQSALR